MSYHFTLAALYIPHKPETPEMCLRYYRVHPINSPLATLCLTCWVKPVLPSEATIKEKPDNPTFQMGRKTLNRKRMSVIGVIHTKRHCHFPLGVIVFSMSEGLHISIYEKALNVQVLTRDLVIRCHGGVEIVLSLTKSHAT